MPEKSFFASLLFLIYINDIVHASKIFLPMLIANDTNYFNKWKNVNDIVNTMKINKLSLIFEKTYVFFRLKEIPVSCSKFYLYIRNYKLKKVQSTKYFVIID